MKIEFPLNPEAFERRYVEGAIEIRADLKKPGGSTIVGLRGYAAKFNVLSENLGGFREQITPGAFDDVLKDDVRALFNHDPNIILGRTAAGTLRVFQDDTGLGYEVEMPDTPQARSLVTSIERGDVSQSSFAFRVARPDGDEWVEDEKTGAITRTIKKFARLYDVSPVTYPAYPDATVGMRALEAWRGERAATIAAQAAEAEKARALRALDNARRARAIRLHQIDC
jgi:HK97 family phage prohead protease